MIIFTFFLGTSILFLQGILFPHFVLLAYAPWIAWLILSYELPKCLSLSFIAGVFLDLLSNDPIGVHALNYTLVTLFLFRFRQIFHSEHPLRLSIFTLFFSFFSTLLQLFLLFLFDRRVPFTGKWALGDLFVMPIADGIYAFFWFALPLMLYKKVSTYWHLLKQHLFPTTH